MKSAFAILAIGAAIALAVWLAIAARSGITVRRFPESHNLLEK